MTVTVGGINPIPQVMIGGAPLPSSVPDTGPYTGLVVADDIAVTWGTDEPVGQPPPSSARVSLLDFTRQWATGRDVVGLPVLLSWSLPGSVAHPGRVFFRGRITDVDLTRTTVQLPDGRTQPLMRVDLECASLETDLGNRTPTDAGWPAETIGARLARVEALAAGVASDIGLRTFWTTPQAAPTDPRTKSVRDHIVALFNSAGGDRFVWSPHTMTYQHLSRRVVPDRTMMRLYDAATGHPRGDRGVYAGANFSRAATGNDPTTAVNLVYLNAQDLEYDDTLSRSAGSRITRVAVTSKDGGNADASRTVLRVDPVANEEIIGERALTLDSVHNWNSWADLNAEDLLAQATQEGAAWRPGPVRWDTRHTGGFELSQQADVLLRGHQVQYPITVQRSWLPTVGIRPFFSLIGGVIGYRRGHWVVDMHLAGWAAHGGGNSTPHRVRQHAITWEEIDDGNPDNTVRWWDGDAPDGMHPTLTLDDLGYVGRGYGSAAVIGPNEGFDT